MAFHVRCNFDRIQSYAQAVHVWKNKSVIFYKDTDPRLPRGLVDKRKKHLSIEQTYAEDIVLRLYGRPIVTWHKDNSVTICSYRSRSTGVFANHCTPVGMYVSSGRNFTVTVDGRTYKVDKEITFRERDGTWKADQITPWSVSRVNRERAKQALDETNYKEFRLWLSVYMQMATPIGFASWGNHIGDETLVGMLRDRKWRELVTKHFPATPADEVLSKVRQAIYREHDCYDSKSVNFLG